MKSNHKWGLNSEWGICYACYFFFGLYLPLSRSFLCTFFSNIYYSLLLLSSDCRRSNINQFRKHGRYLFLVAKAQNWSKLKCNGSESYLGLNGREFDLEMKFSLADFIFWWNVSILVDLEGFCGQRGLLVPRQKILTDILGWFWSVNHWIIQPRTHHYRYVSLKVKNGNLWGIFTFTFEI